MNKKDVCAQFQCIAGRAVRAGSACKTDHVDDVETHNTCC
jgi:hypothetical protein